VKAMGRSARLQAKEEVGDTRLLMSAWCSWALSLLSQATGLSSRLEQMGFLLHPSDELSHEYTCVILPFNRPLRALSRQKHRRW
jgi:hypothetical protein